MSKYFKLTVFGMLMLLALFTVSCSKVDSTLQSSEPGSEELIVATTGGIEDKVPDPNAKEFVIISLYHISDDKIGQEMEAVDTLEASELVAKLIEYGVLAEDTDLLGFTVEGDGAKLDLSKFDSSDRRIVVCVANTFIENLSLSSLDILVDGKPGQGTEKLVYESDFDSIKK